MLITCPDCGREMSDAAPACPGCGRPAAGASTPVQVVAAKKGTSCSAAGCAGLLLLAGLLWIGSLFNSVPAPSMGGPAAPVGPRVGVLYSDVDKDIKVTADCKLGGFGTVGLWDLTLTNTSKTVTYQDLMYRTMYESESGSRLKTNRATLGIVLKPGEVRKIRGHNDGLIPSQTKRCGFAVYAAMPRAIAAPAPAGPAKK